MDTDQIRAVVFAEDKTWVAQCIDYDIAVQGANMAEVRERLELTLQMERQTSKDAGKPAFDGLPSAPAHFHEMFERASNTMTSSSGASTDVEMKLAA